MPLYYGNPNGYDNIVINTTATGGTSPLAGFGIYGNGSTYNLNNVAITTSGSKADAIQANNGTNNIRIETFSVVTTGSSADGINVTENAVNSTVSIGDNASISAEGGGMGVRANTSKNGGKNQIVLGKNAHITTAGGGGNWLDGTGYAVYAGNRDLSNTTYKGDARIDGVPGTHAPVPLEFRDTAGSSCGALLPTGNVVDTIDGVACTLIDNGMPCIVMKAADLGATGYETREELEGDGFAAIRARIESIRLAAGPLMNLGEVKDKTVPKMFLVASPRNGGAICTRSFIPHRAHATIGVLAAVSVATASLLKGSPANEVAEIPAGARKTLSVEHPTGEMSCVLEVNEAGEVVSSALLRTARKLMDGVVFA